MIVTLLAGLLLAQAGDPRPLKLATYAYPRYDRTAALQPLARHIEAQLGRPVEVVLLPTPDALRDALLAGEVDVAMTNLAAFVGVSQANTVQPIAVLDVPDTTRALYRGVLVARRAAGLASLDDVARESGRLRYAEVLPGSTSGALVQAERLRAAGISAGSFAALHRSGTHEAALAELLAGSVDVAAFADEPWRRLQNENPGAAAPLVEVWRSEPLPPGPVVCVPAPTTPCERIGEAMLRPDAAAAAAALARGWSETEGAARFRPFEPALYAPFRR